MKLYTKFLTLIAASTVYSYSSGIFKRDNALNVGPECQNDMDTVEEFKCLGTNGGLTLETAKTLCPFILSDQCKKFFEDPLSYLPNCKDEEDFKALSSPEALKSIIKIREMDCSTDGEGNICPAAKVNLNNENINEDTVMASCKSKKCSTALDGAFDVLINEMMTAVEEQNIGEKHGDENVFVYLKDLLNSEACTSLTVDDSTKTDATTSGASTNMSKLYSSLILAIAATLFYF